MDNQDESNVKTLQMALKVQTEDTDTKAFLRDLEGWFRHAETIGQARLNTFTFTESVLIAACGILLKDDAETGSILAALFISIVGLLFAASCFALGRRQVKFHLYIERVADGAINKMPPGERDSSTYAIVRNFQHGHHRTVDTHSPYDVDLHRPETFFSARRFLYVEPVVFMLCFTALLVLGGFLLYDP